MIFICYEKCSTCAKALRHLKEMHIDVEVRPIKDGVSVEELRQWIPLSHKTIHQFFNTSGISYREGNYKEKRQTMSEDELLASLASDGMLVKRPLLIGDDFVLVGYRESEYAALGEKYGKE